MEAIIVPFQPPTFGNLITILSIDGGGIRGIIPGIIIDFLESELQVPLYVAFFKNIIVTYVKLVYKIHIWSYTRVL